MGGSSFSPLGCAHLLESGTAPAKAPIGALGVEIVERAVCPLMRLGCRGDDASRRNTRPGLAATDDGEVRAARGECFCRRQPNAIGGTRDQDLLVVRGTAIQGYGHAG